MPVVRHGRLDRTPVAADRVRVFVVEHVVVHALHLAVEHDLAHHAVALIELCIGDRLAVRTTRTINAETVQRIAKKRRLLARGALVHALPRIPVVVVLRRVGMAEAAVGMGRQLHVKDSKTLEILQKHPECFAYTF